MEANMLTEFLLQDCLVLVPALWVVGAVLKATPKAPDWHIPYVLAGLGVAGAWAIVGFGPEGVIQGILAAGAAVFGHQLMKQAQKGGRQE